jgi:hypothetical protein
VGRFRIAGHDSCASDKATHETKAPRLACVSNAKRAVFSMRRYVACTSGEQQVARGRAGVVPGHRLPGEARGSSSCSLPSLPVVTSLPMPGTSPCPAPAHARHQPLPGTNPCPAPTLARHHGHLGGEKVATVLRDRGYLVCSSPGFLRSARRFGGGMPGRHLAKRNSRRPAGAGPWSPGKPGGGGGSPRSRFGMISILTTACECRVETG